jgi:hypothetical protein
VYPNLITLFHFHRLPSKRMSSRNQSKSRFTTIMTIVRIFLFANRLDRAK